MENKSDSIESNPSHVQENSTASQTIAENNNPDSNSSPNQNPQNAETTNNSNENTTNENANNEDANKAKNDKNEENSEQVGQKRKRTKSRWGTPPRKKRWGDGKKIIPTQQVITIDQTPTKIFLYKMKLQELNTKLINPAAWLQQQKIEERSPSPEPVYDNKGVRTNTREQRLKEKLVDERNYIIGELIKLDPTFQTPADYKPPKLTKKNFYAY